MAIKCPKCNKSDDVCINDGPDFEDDDCIYATFDCERCNISFKMWFAITPYDEEILEDGCE